jgi:hypothetical protein
MSPSLGELKMTEQNTIQENRLKEIIERRLLRMPPEKRALLHPVLQKDTVSWIVLGTPTYFVLAFADDADKKRALELKEKKLRPFPALVSYAEGQPVAFRVGSSKKTILDNVVVKGMFAFQLGKDVSLIIRDFNHQVIVRELGEYDYKIKLGYIVSLGEEINQANLLDSLEDLIVYSIQHLASKNATHSS